MKKQITITVNVGWIVTLFNFIVNLIMLPFVATIDFFSKHYITPKELLSSFYGLLIPVLIFEVTFLLNKELAWWVGIILGLFISCLELLPSIFILLIAILSQPTLKIPTGPNISVWLGRVKTIDAITQTALAIFITILGWGILFFWLTFGIGPFLLGPVILFLGFLFKVTVFIKHPFYVCYRISPHMATSFLTM